MMCEICQKEVKQSLFKDGICSECWKEVVEKRIKFTNIVAYCRTCGIHDFTNAAKMRFTKDQREEMKASSLTIVIFINDYCIFCGDTFYAPYRIKFIAKEPHV